MKELPRNVQRTLEKLKKEYPTYIEVKIIKNRFYVFTSTSEWDKKEKKPRKITNYLGVISRDGSFIKKKTRTFQESSREIFEYGNGTLAYTLIDDCKKILDDLTPYSDEIIASAIIKVIDPKPLRLLSSRWEKLYLSKVIDANLSPKHMSNVLKEIGKDISWQYTLFEELTPKGDLLLYDLTTVFTYSKNIKLAEKGYNPDHKYIDQIGVILAFSTSNNLPIGIDIFYGSVRDITTIRDFVARLPTKNVGFIFDKGFSSYKLIDELRDGKIDYIVPLRKDSKELCDIQGVEWKEPFKYRKRPIRWSIKSSPYGILYLFDDPLLRGEEECVLLRRVEEKKLTMKEFENKKKVAGIMGFLSNLDKPAKQIFDLYKGREDVELAFDAMKNTLDADKTYLQTPEGVRGFYLTSFLALRVYFKILKRLREKELTNKLSVEEVLFELSKVEKIVEKKSGREYFAKIPKRSRDIMALFSDWIPMG